MKNSPTGIPPFANKQNLSKCHKTHIIKDMYIKQAKQYKIEKNKTKTWIMIKNETFNIASAICYTMDDGN